MSYKAKVIAYYTPPKGPVEKHEMWQVDYADAKKYAEGDRWSLTPPKDGAKIDDNTVATDMTPPPKANPPPTVERPE